MIDPIAYLKILLHTKRFWNDTIPEEKRQYVYGALVGYVEEGVRYVLDYVPLFHSKNELDFEKKHSFFMKLDKLNKNLASQEEPDYIVGWIRSSNKDELEISEIDKKNQIYLQTAYQDKGILITVLIPTLEYDYGIEVNGFIDEIYTLDTNSILAGLDWDYDEIADVDELFKMVVDLDSKRGKSTPIIKELGEVSIKLP